MAECGFERAAVGAKKKSVLGRVGNIFGGTGVSAVLPAVLGWSAISRVSNHPPGMNLNDTCTQPTRTLVPEGSRTGVRVLWYIQRYVPML